MKTVALSLFDVSVRTQVKANINQIMLGKDKGEEKKEETKKQTFCTKVLFLLLQTTSFRLL